MQYEQEKKSKGNIEKVRKLAVRPGPYPIEPCSENYWIQACSAMRQHQQIVLKSYPIKTKPFDFLFEICSYSNAIASAYHLTPDQHKVLIQNQIPAYHDLYRELELLYNVEQVFELANSTTELTPTKKEAQAELERWKLDRSSRTALHASISQLKMLICDTEGIRMDARDDFVLFSLMIKRIEREELSSYVRRKLDDFSISIRTETNAAKMHGQLVNLLLTMGTGTDAEPAPKKVEKAPVVKRLGTISENSVSIPNPAYTVPVQTNYFPTYQSYGAAPTVMLPPLRVLQTDSTPLPPAAANPKEKISSGAGVAKQEGQKDGQEGG